jgi:hypothetical protein
MPSSSSKVCLVPRRRSPDYAAISKHAHDNVVYMHPDILQILIRAVRNAQNALQISHAMSAYIDKCVILRKNGKSCKSNKTNGYHTLSLQKARLVSDAMTHIVKNAPHPSRGIFRRMAYWTILFDSQLLKFKSRHTSNMMMPHQTGGGTHTFVDAVNKVIKTLSSCLPTKNKNKIQPTKNYYQNPLRDNYAAAIREPNAIGPGSVVARNAGFAVISHQNGVVPVVPATALRSSSSRNLPGLHSIELVPVSSPEPFQQRNADIPSEHAQDMQPMSVIDLKSDTTSCPRLDFLIFSFLNACIENVRENVRKFQEHKFDKENPYAAENDFIKPMVDDITACKDLCAAVVSVDKNMKAFVNSLKYINLLQKCNVHTFDRFYTNVGTLLKGKLDTDILHITVIHRHMEEKNLFKVPSSTGEGVPNYIFNYGISYRQIFLSRINDDLESILRRVFDENNLCLNPYILRIGTTATTSATTATMRTITHAHNGFFNFNIDVYDPLNILYDPLRDIRGVMFLRDLLNHQLTINNSFTTLCISRILRAPTSMNEPDLITDQELYKNIRDKHETPSENDRAVVQMWHIGLDYLSRVLRYPFLCLIETPSPIFHISLIATSNLYDCLKNIRKFNA